MWVRLEVKVRVLHLAKDPEEAAVEVVMLREHALLHLGMLWSQWTSVKFIWWSYSSFPPTWPVMESRKTLDPPVSILPQPLGSAFSVSILSLSSF